MTHLFSFFFFFLSSAAGGAGWRAAKRAGWRLCGGGGGAGHEPHARGPAAANPDPRAAAVPRVARKCNIDIRFNAPPPFRPPQWCPPCDWCPTANGSDKQKERKEKKIMFKCKSCFSLFVFEHNNHNSRENGPSEQLGRQGSVVAGRGASGHYHGGREMG